MKKLLLSSVVASSILATAGLAQIATDGTGQFLVAPAFYAKSGFETNLKLVNTNLRSSVIMRGVIRDYVGSNEFDFVITLSPSDVWEARIYQGADGKVYIQSSDDSNYQGALATPKSISGWGDLKRSFTNGYVEFYPIAQFNEGSDAKVAKRVTSPATDTLDARFDTLVALSTAINDGDTITTPGTTAGTTTVNYVDNNSIGGYVTLIKPEWKASMVLPMMAFENVTATPITIGGTARAAREDTSPALYINPLIVYNDLNVNSVTLPYSESGTRDALYFTFWGDYFGSDKTHYTDKGVTDLNSCLQARSFSSTSRDMEENRSVNAADPFSGDATVDSSVNVVCEQKGLPVSTFKPNYSKGMVQLFGFDQTNDQGGAINSNTTSLQGDSVSLGTQTQREQPRFIATHMTATMIDGSPSYSWVYPFVNKRP